MSSVSSGHRPDAESGQDYLAVLAKTIGRDGSRSAEAVRRMNRQFISPAVGQWSYVLNGVALVKPAATAGLAETGV